MSFRDFPDPKVPESQLRCEAMTKPTTTYQTWRQLSHRCIRKAIMSRAGHAVCATHGSMPNLSYWDGITPDSFKHRNQR